MKGGLWRFGDCEFDEQRNELRVGGRIVEIETKPLDVLRVLLQHRGEVVSKEEILRQAWPGLTVVEASLATAISKLRKALGDGQDWIVTVPRVGYRFVAAEFLSEPEPLHPTSLAAPPQRPAWIPIGMAVALFLALGAAVMAWLPDSRSQSIRVESLRLMGPERETEYLGAALSDEISTLISQADSVVVSRSGTQPTNSIVRGHYQTGAGTLFLTLQVWGEAGKKLLWQESLHTPLANLVGLQAQLALLVRGAMGRALRISVKEEAMTSQDPTAYRLYLESLGQLSDREANRRAIALLEESTKRDDAFAPAWLALSKRYYIEDRYAQNRQSQKSVFAVRRAMSASPSYTAAAANLIISAVERGEVGIAIEEARRIVQRRPTSVEAHFSLSYALRFAGQLRDSARECEIAYTLDSRNHMTGLRSCAVVHILLSDYAKAYPYLELDGDSDFARLLRMEILLRQGKRNEALALLNQLEVRWDSLPVLRAELQGLRSEAVEALARKVPASDDPETNYFYAAHLAYSGSVEPSLSLLEKSLAGGYMQADAMRHDPMLANLQGRAGFEEICERARQAQVLLTAQRP